MTREELLKAEYETKLLALRREQQNCIHVWGNTVYDPEIIDEPIYETRWQGVDCWPAIVGFKKVKRDRWSRTCKKCGKVEHSKELVAVRFEPKF